MAQHQVVNFADHGAVRVMSGHGADLGDKVMACLTVPFEFRRVQTEFPIVFRRDLTTGAYAAWALFGFEDGENLFLDGNRWDAQYKPLAIQPFLIGRASAGGDAQVHIDVAHDRVRKADASGVALFDDIGQPSAYLQTVAAMLGDLDEGYQAAPQFFAALQKFDLIEPFSLEVPGAGGGQHSLVGFHTVNETRVQQLDSAALGALSEEGHLMPLFMVLASLSNFTKLVARRAQRDHLG